MHHKQAYLRMMASAARMPSTADDMMPPA